MLEAALRDLWLDAPDRDAVTRAANEIDRILAADPTSQIVERHEELYRMEIRPLSVQFTFDEGGSRVIVWTVRELSR